MKLMKKIGVWIFILGFIAPILHAAQPKLDYQILKYLPIQNEGRVKPFDTFARDSVRTITGSEYFNGHHPIGMILDWIANANVWRKRPCILIGNLQLKKMLGMTPQENYATYSFLVHRPGFLAYARANILKKQAMKQLNAEQTESMMVYGRLELFSAIISGDAISIIPISGHARAKWDSIGELQRAYLIHPQSMPKPAKTIMSLFATVVSSYFQRNTTMFAAASRQLCSYMKQVGGPNYANWSHIALEVTYNTLRPFRKAWIIFLIAAIFMALSLLKFSKLFWIGFAAYILGVLISITGFVMRCIIAGRPPVTNMYESIIWVTFGCTVFALIFFGIFKNRLLLLSASILGVFGFLIADCAPLILDPSIQPLEPVLRSNYWLTAHVLTITLSYAAFLLSLGMGHVCFWTMVKLKDPQKLKTQTQMLYRVVQVGVVLLAAGTILGGIWASYSWGKFWGWDPKETWALIALLGYIAVLHGRVAGWLKDRGFSMAVVIAFLGVLMAWYGVNFVLGVGLHSYGFAKGGIRYVITFTSLDILLVIWVGWKTRNGAQQNKLQNT
jgi:cytochrome c-type biogenesis protein CcsB